MLWIPRAQSPVSASQGRPPPSPLVTRPGSGLTPAQAEGETQALGAGSGRRIEDWKPSRTTEGFRGSGWAQARLTSRHATWQQPGGLLQSAAGSTSVQAAACAVQRAVFSVNCLACSVQCELFSVQSAECSVQCAA